MNQIIFIASSGSHKNTLISGFKSRLRRRKELSPLKHPMYLIHQLAQSNAAELEGDLFALEALMKFTDLTETAWDWANWLSCCPILTPPRQGR